MVVVVVVMERVAMALRLAWGAAVVHGLGLVVRVVRVVCIILADPVLRRATGGAGRQWRRTVAQLRAAPMGVG